jgi:hypothetical protein
LIPWKGIIGQASGKRRLLVMVNTTGEIGGWFEEDLKRLEDDIRDLLPADVHRLKLTPSTLLNGDREPAGTVLFVTIVPPDDEVDYRTLLVHARLVRLHAVLARRMNETQLREAEHAESPMFLIQAQKKYQDKDYRFAEETLLAAAPATQSPTWPSAVPNPQTSTSIYASGIAKMFARCQLSEYEITTLYLDETAREENLPNQLLGLLRFLFHIKAPKPSAGERQSIRRRLAGILTSDPAPDPVFYVVAESLKELNDFLDRVSQSERPRSTRALVNSGEDLRSFMKSQNLWKATSTEAPVQGRYLTYMEPRGGGQEIQTQSGVSPVPEQHE